MTEISILSSNPSKYFQKCQTVLSFLPLFLLTTWQTFTSDQQGLLCKCAIWCVGFFPTFCHVTCHNTRSFSHTPPQTAAEKRRGVDWELSSNEEFNLGIVVSVKSAKLYLIWHVSLKEGFIPWVSPYFLVCPFKYHEQRVKGPFPQPFQDGNIVLLFWGACSGGGCHFWTFAAQGPLVFP